jgi:hypothetical protein
VPNKEKAIIKTDWNHEGPWEFLSRYWTICSVISSYIIGMIQRNEIVIKPAIPCPAWTRVRRKSILQKTVIKDGQGGEQSRDK